MSTVSLLIAAASLGTAAAPAVTQHGQFPSSFASTTNSALVIEADPPAHARGRGRGNRDADRRSRRVYDDRGRYINPRRLGRDDRIWRGRDGNYYCERDNGTTGLVIGAGLGALAGRAIDTRGDRTVGTLLGAIAGGLVGREIDRGELNCR